MRIKDVDPLMKEKFIGGKGYGLKLLWEATRPDTRWMILRMR
jgi:aldehyde:ferredoxin oxidoreductase